MEVENIKVKSIKLTEKEKDQLDAAWDIVHRLTMQMKGYLIIDNSTTYTMKEVLNIEGFLANLVDADRIIAG